MTTLQINDTQVESLIDKYGQNAIIEYIKTFSPTKLHNKEKDKFQILKNQKFERKGILCEAFNSLNQKLSQTALSSIDLEREKEDYFAKKYKL
ncbi:hypothetical protein MNB_SV-6-906 [hydrothermal vent metagenome]|uniref:Uncharacterized protein n=1 Tax=hydrothermal vent metagenome TaxID=652676 RepID=A0A1W1B8Q6_9ZZZZ